MHNTIAMIKHKPYYCSILYVHINKHSMWWKCGCVKGKKSPEAIHTCFQLMVKLITAMHYTCHRYFSLLQWHTSVGTSTIQ